MLEGYKNIRSPSLAVAGFTAFVAIALLLFFPSTAPADPAIRWTPRSINETINTAQSKTISVSFVADNDIRLAEIWITPGLQPYVKVNSPLPEKIKEHQRISFNITLYAPVDASPGIIQGAIQIRGREHDEDDDNPGSQKKHQRDDNHRSQKTREQRAPQLRTLARPLPVTIEAIGFQIISSPQSPIDFMHTKITINTYDPSGISEFFISTSGLQKNVWELTYVNWGDQPPNQTGRVTYDLAEIFPPSRLGIDVEQLRELQVVVKITGNSGETANATTTIPFR